MTRARAAGSTRTMKYYYPEHLAGYQRMLGEGKRSWDEIHGQGHGFEFFSSRSFLEQILPRLSFETDTPRALELGSGTGPGACFLAQRGFSVDAIDLIPAAIDLARQIAAERGLDIRYEVMDVTELPHQGSQYDLIVDSYCLQGIVLDPDRRKVFAAVRARLKPRGTYLISTAMYTSRRHHPERSVRVHRSGKVLHRFDDDGWFDPETAILYSPLLVLLSTPGFRPEDFPDAVQISGTPYLPRRRYWNPSQLRAELEDQGFRVLLQSGDLGQHVVCVHQHAPIVELR